MGLFNRKHPERYEDAAEEWMQKARRAIQSGVPVEFTYRVTMTNLGGKIQLYVWFVASHKSFETTPKKDPVRFVKKEVIPWILQNGQHV